MKKSIITLIIMFVVTLSACGNNSESNTIMRAELTDRENAILSTTSSQSFVFDYDIESDYKEVAAWVEKYEFGELVNERIGHLTTEPGNNGSIILTLDETDKSDNEIFFNIGINSIRDSSTSTGSSTILEVISTKGTDGRSSMNGSFTEEIEIMNDEMVLASIVFAWDKSSMNSLPDEFYRNAEHRNNVLENHEVVYLLKTAFTK